MDAGNRVNLPNLPNLPNINNAQGANAPGVPLPPLSPVSVADPRVFSAVPPSLMVPDLSDLDNRAVSNNGVSNTFGLRPRPTNTLNLPSVPSVGLTLSRRGDMRSAGGVSPNSGAR